MSLRGGTTKQSLPLHSLYIVRDCFVPRNDIMVIAMISVL
jgi:hypothetical protein